MHWWSMSVSNHQSTVHARQNHLPKKMDKILSKDLNFIKNGVSEQVNIKAGVLYGMMALYDIVSKQPRIQCWMGSLDMSHLWVQVACKEYKECM